MTTATFPSNKQWIWSSGLREHHVPFEQLVLPDEIHGFLMWATWIKVYDATADFFDRTLKEGQKIGDGSGSATLQ